MMERVPEMELTLVAYQHALVQNIKKLQETKKLMESCTDSSQKRSLESSLHEISERISEIGEKQRPLIIEHRIRMQTYHKLKNEKISVVHALGLQTKSEYEEHNTQHSRLRRQRTTATGAATHPKRQQQQSRSRRNRKAPAKYDPSPQQENAVENQKRAPRQRRAKQAQPLELESAPKLEGDLVDAEPAPEEEPGAVSTITGISNNIDNNNTAVNSPTPPSRNTRSQKGVLKPSRIKHLLEKPKRQRRTRNEIEAEILEPGAKRTRRSRKPQEDSGVELESGEIINCSDNGPLEAEAPPPPLVAPTFRAIPPGTIRIIRVPVDQFSGSSSGHSSPRLDVKPLVSS